jgi:hypothetical protein
MNTDYFRTGRNWNLWFNRLVKNLGRSRGDEAQIKTKLETPHVVSYDLKKA